MNWFKNLFNTDEIAQEIIEKSTSNQETISALQTEVSRLQAELNAKNVYANDVSNKLVKKRNALEETREAIRYQVTENKRLQKNYDELKSKKSQSTLSSKNNRLKEQIVVLSEALAVTKDSRDLNKSLREAYEFIEDMSNKQDLMKNLGHNFKRYVDENNINITTLAKELGLVRETLRRIYESTRGTSVTTFKLIEYDMCKYFNCMPVDLVKGRVEK